MDAERKERGRKLQRDGRGKDCCCVYCVCSLAGLLDILTTEIGMYLSKEPEDSNKQKVTKKNSISSLN